jgi:hypothetical protein
VTSTDEVCDVFETAVYIFINFVLMEMVVVEFQCYYKYRPEERKALIVM